MHPPLSPALPVPPLAPRCLTTAMIEQRSMVPDDAAAIERLFEFLKHTQPKLAEIRAAICEFYLVSRADLMCRKGSPRERLFVRPRQMYSYFAHKYARASLNLISERLGYLDHTSVVHGIRNIERLALGQTRGADEIDLIRLRICEKILLRRREHDAC
jgi:chromosomal replication initiation ATPase DnaA